MQEEQSKIEIALGFLKFSPDASLTKAPEGKDDVVAVSSPTTVYFCCV